MKFDSNNNINREAKEQIAISTAEFHLLYDFKMSLVEKRLKELEGVVEKLVTWGWRIVVIGSISLTLLGKEALWKYMVP